MLHHFLNFNSLHDYMTRLAARYTTYRIVAPTWNEIYTSDPANVEYILKLNFDNDGKGSHNHNNLRDLLGDGIFTIDGEKWRNQRKISSYEFSTKVLRDYSSVAFRENAAKLANLVAGAADLARFLQLKTDPKYLRDIILNFIIAGKDTTAATLSWFIYML